MPTFTGDAGNNTLTGTEGEDALVDTLGGNDTLVGLGGNDTVTVTRASGGSYAYSTIDIDGGEGDDAISVTGAANATFRGVIRGGAGADTITLANVDFTNGNFGSLVVHAGDGNDILNLDMTTRGAIVNLGAGADRINLTGAAGIRSYDPTISFTDFAAGADGDIIDLAAWLNSGAVPGYVPGTNPFETGLLRVVQYDNVSDWRTQIEIMQPGDTWWRPIITLANVRPGELTIENLGGFRFQAAVLNGTDNENILEGSGETDTLNGLGGNDTLVGWGDDDTLNGGAGVDTLFGDGWKAEQTATGDDVLNGGDGNDSMVGGGGDDVLTGGDGDDIIYTGVVGSSSPYIYGGAWFSTLTHERDGGYDVVDGGAGIDWAALMYTHATEALVLDVSDPNVVANLMVGGVARGSVTGLESISFYGGSAGDTITAGGLNDNLFGNGGDDVLNGGAGDDILRGDAGADRLNGGAGIDVVDYSTATAGVTIDLAAQGAAIVGGGAPGDILTGVEGLSGSVFADVLLGDDGANVLGDALAGSDVIEGRGGDDVLAVGHEFELGDVRMDGGDGDDVVVGSQANSFQLIGGAGADVITLGSRAAASTVDAGAGHDIVHLEMTYASSTVTLGAGLDTLVLSGTDWASKTQTVTDFVAGNGGDVIDMGDWEAQGAFNPFVQPNNIRLVQVGNDAVIQVNTEPFSAPVWVNALVLQNVQVSSLTAANFRGYNPSPAGWNQIAGAGLSDTLTGTAGNDEITGQNGSDALRGGDGDDIILAGGPSYNQLAAYRSGLDGGAGNDVLRSDVSGDVLVGGTGSDALFGGLGNDTLVGGGGALINSTQTVNLFGQPMTVIIPGVTTPTLDDGVADRLFGDEGDDVIYVGRGDLASGGEGVDRMFASLASVASGVTLNLASGANAALGALLDAEISGFESFVLDLTAFADNVSTGDGVNSLNGGAGDDVLTGGASANTLTGGTGIDTLQGGGGADTLAGGEYGFAATLPGGTIVAGRLTDDGQADTLLGGEGSDTVFVGLGDTADGGAGSDILQATLTGRGSGVNLDLRSDALLRLQAVQGGTLTSFETISSLQLTQFDDVLSMGDLGFAYGGAGADQIIGNGLWQQLFGEDGDDVLNGGLGNDTLNGGAGVDTAVFQGARSTYTFTTVNATTTRVVGSDGTDMLTGIERLRFSDGLFDLAGNALPNEMTGTPGADVLYGTDGVDLISGGDGDDIITGQDGNDTIDGGAGMDTAVVFGDAVVSIVGNGGTITMTSADGTDTLTNIESVVFNGEAFAVAGLTGAILLGGSAGDTLTGGVTNDLLRGGGGANVLNGGDGVDTADYGSAGTSVTARLDIGTASNNGHGAADTLNSIENLTGSMFNDTLFGSSAANVLRGGEGRDTILGLGGNDVISGGAGVANELYGGQGGDTYIVGAVGDSIVEQAGEGHDLVQTTLGQLTLSANVEDLTYTGSGAFVGVGNGLGNTIRGGTQRDVLIGGGGNDVLWGGAGLANELYGGTGDDTYRVEAADSIVEASGEGTDTVVVEGGLTAYNLGANLENLTYAGAAAFTGGGNGLDNVLTGGTGADTLMGRGGADALNGGAGTDTASYILAGAGVTARLDIGRATNDGEGGTDTFSGIENLTGSNLRDTLFGDAGANVIDGAIGNDVLLGLGGNDVLIGGSGGGNNEMYGGTGDDLYVVDAGDTLIENAGEGIDTVQTTMANFTLRANVENMTYVGPGDFAGTGNASDNVIAGSNGHDTLMGMGGNDTLNGGQGQDLALLRGVRADYTIEAVEGGYRVTDSVAGRDGVDLLLGVESVRFSDGSVLVLGTPGAAPEVMPLLSDKQIDGDAFVLPAILDDQPLVLPGEALAKGDLDGDPLVLPGAPVGAGLLAALLFDQPLFERPLPNGADDSFIAHDRDWM